MSAAVEKARLHSPDLDWFEIDVTLRRGDGVERVYRDVATRDGWEFIWSEGNYACDCNRYTFFERAGDHEPTDEEEDLYGQCGDDRYAVVRVVDVASGEILHEGELRP